jgi:hypothetical protein
MAESGPPAPDIGVIQRWCERRVPDHVRDRLRVECEVAARHVTIVERAPGLGTEWMTTPVARLRYTKRTGLWTLYWRDRNLQFHLYDVIPPSPRIQYLLDELNADEDALFWG